MPPPLSLRLADIAADLRAAV
jgi:hypothetical protein